MKDKLNKTLWTLRHPEEGERGDVLNGRILYITYSEQAKSMYFVDALTGNVIWYTSDLKNKIPTKNGMKFETLNHVYDFIRLDTLLPSIVNIKSSEAENYSSITFNDLQDYIKSAEREDYGMYNLQSVNEMRIMNNKLCIWAMHIYNHKQQVNIGIREVYSGSFYPLVNFVFLSDGNCNVVKVNKGVADYENPIKYKITDDITAIDYNKLFGSDGDSIKEILKDALISFKKSSIE